jgi:hypothetical protein
MSEAGGELLGHSFSMFKMGQTLPTFQVKISIIGYVRSHFAPVNLDQLFPFQTSPTIIILPLGNEMISVWTHSRKNNHNDYYWPTGQRFKSSTPIIPSSFSYFCMGTIVMVANALMD